MYYVICVIATRCIIDTLQQARSLYDESLAKLTVLTDATNQKISLTKHIAKECSLEVLDLLCFSCLSVGIGTSVEDCD